NVRVVFTITNFDPTTGMLTTADDANVVGTSANSIQVVSSVASSTVSKLPTSDVSHTFTLSDGSYRLNVPIPPAPTPGGSIQVTFSTEFTARGTFDWGCVILCGTSNMQAPEAMYGSLTVS
ncbi:MAG: hypothetical protein L3J96_04550, partial [Thermoplasmata archaeon]|nr:hypothetical protein [Thermoplasmata archaeon]